MRSRSRDLPAPADRRRADLRRRLRARRTLPGHVVRRGRDRARRRPRRRRGTVHRRARVRPRLSAARGLLRLRRARRVDAAAAAPPPVRRGRVGVVLVALAGFAAAERLERARVAIESRADGWRSPRWRSASARRSRHAAPRQRAAAGQPCIAQPERMLTTIVREATPVASCAHRVRAARRRRGRLSRLCRQRALRRVAARARTTRSSRAACSAIRTRRTAPSRASTRIVDAARARRSSRFLDAGDDYVVVFTANASAAIKLVARELPVRAAAPLRALGRQPQLGERHPRVCAARRRARVDVSAARRQSCGSTHAEPRRLAQPDGARALRLSGAVELLRRAASAVAGRRRRRRSASTCCSTRRRSCRRTRSACAPARPTSSRSRSTRCSAIRPASARWSRGARRWRSCAGRGSPAARSTSPRCSSTHRLRDGTTASRTARPTSSSIAALDAGFDLLDEIGLDRARRRTSPAHRRSCCAACERCGTRTARRWSRLRAGDDAERGGTVAFNLLDATAASCRSRSSSSARRARASHVRGGCFCNPGAAEAAFGFDGERMAHVGPAPCARRWGWPTRAATCAGCIAVLRSFTCPPVRSLAGCAEHANHTSQ